MPIKCTGSGGVLDFPGEMTLGTCPVKISRPNVLGDISRDLCINYDTGEDVYVDLHGVAIDLDVRLNQSELHIAPTYIDLLKILN